MLRELKRWIKRSVVRPARLRLKNEQSRLVRRVVGESVIGLLVRTEQGLFVVDPEDMGVGRELVVSGRYGSREVEIIARCAGPDGRVLFVGAHVGALAIPVSKIVGAVTAIEANPNTFRLLAANVLLNECRNVRVLHLAADERQRTIQFVLNRTNSGGSKRMPVVARRDYFYDKPAIVDVPANRLDDMVPPEFDVVVMDIEGSEYFALSGMPNLLARAGHLIVEFLPHAIRDVAGVSVDDFVRVIEPHFSVLFVPSKDLTVPRSAFLETLSQMYVRNEFDDGLVFSKTSNGFV